MKKRCHFTTISKTSNYWEGTKEIRWCRECGAIQTFILSDNRIYDQESTPPNNYPPGYCDFKEEG